MSRVELICPKKTAKKYFEIPVRFVAVNFIFSKLSSGLKHFAKGFPKWQFKMVLALVFFKTDPTPITFGKSCRGWVSFGKSAPKFRWNTS